MAFIDWDALELHHYLLLGGGAIMLLLVMLFLIPRVRSTPGMRIPAILGGTLSGLVIGGGLGILLMTMLGYRLGRPDPWGRGMGRPVDPAVMGMGRGGMGGMGAVGGGDPPPQRQLANLVIKLDLLTRKPLQLTLTEQERAAVREQLAGLADGENLEDEESRRRLQGVLEILKGHRDTLEAAGYRWPGPGGGINVWLMPNPFREEEHGQHLQALQQRLGG